MILGESRWLLALLLVLALGVAMLAGSTIRRRALTKAFGPAVLARIVPATVRVRRAVRDVAVLAGLALTAVALAEPLYGERVFTMEREGIDMVLVLDLSRSMACTDVDPTRLQRMQREVYDLLDVVEEDNVGIVAFAGGAFPRLPLTEDHDAVRQVVGELDTNTFQTQGSAMGAAIRESLKLLERRKGEADRAILVMSDGEVHDPADALAAASEAKAADVRIFAIGIGEAASPVPGPTGAFIRDRATGAAVQSVPSEDLLKDLARATGGAYVHSVAAADDVRTLYRDEIRKRLATAGRGTMQKKTRDSGFEVPLMGALACLLTGLWLGDGRRPWGAAARAASVLLALALAGDALAASVPEADEAYRAGRYGEAVEQYTELVRLRPSDPELWGRLAAARYRSADAEGAARAWETEGRLKGGDADASYNAGNAQVAARRLDEAVRLYEQALAADPEHPGAKQNLALVKQEIEARQQNQPKPKDEQNPGDSDPNAKKDGAQEGDPKEGEGEKKDGEQDPKQQKPNSEGTPSEKDPGGQAEKQAEQGKEGENSERGKETDKERDGAEPGGDVNTGDLQATGDPTSATAAEGEGTGAPIGVVAAENVLDGVEEGRPRLVVPGDGTVGKPW